MIARTIPVTGGAVAIAPHPFLRGGALLSYRRPGRPDIEIPLTRGQSAEVIDSLIARRDAPRKQEP